MTVTKITKTKADYHTWLPSEFSAGDIIGVEESIGRPADQLTIESGGGQSVIRINVVQKAFKNQGVDNAFMAGGINAAFYTKPEAPVETEITKDDIIIEENATWFLENEMPIKDIKIVTKATNMKITVS